MKLKISIFLLFFKGISFAQDAHLSMYDAAPLFLNPSLTGVVDGSFRVHGQYRTQWKAVNFKPYTSALISFDMPVKKWGFGVQINNFRAGAGNFNALQGLLSAAYYVPLNKKKSHILNFGVQGGITQKSLEYELLSFNNQYTLNNGGEFDQTIVSGENFGGQSKIIPMLNAGISYYYSKPQARLNPFIGFSAFNLLEPNESFFGNKEKLPLRFYTHLGTRINITELFYLIPKVLIMNQKKFSEQTFAVEAGYFLKSAETHLLAGIIFRSKDALIATIGARKDRYILKVGYDFNVSSLNRASTGRGGFEISFTYIHKKYKKTEAKICPRL
ncbi:MAG TPA: PorP/SprF family type IX secretion system membrane protein [Fluviicola sp.]|nr:PorP/SprF family type IX secretion system membrane protein [Fluviicola sp.]